MLNNDSVCIKETFFKACFMKGSNHDLKIRDFSQNTGTGENSPSSKEAH